MTDSKWEDRSVRTMPDSKPAVKKQWTIDAITDAVDVLSHAGLPIKMDTIRCDKRTVITIPLDPQVFQVPWSNDTRSGVSISNYVLKGPLCGDCEQPAKTLHIEVQMDTEHHRSHFGAKWFHCGVCAVG